MEGEAENGLIGWEDFFLRAANFKPIDSFDDLGLQSKSPSLNQQLNNDADTYLYDSSI